MTAAIAEMATKLVRRLRLSANGSGKHGLTVSKVRWHDRRICAGARCALTLSLASVLIAPGCSEEEKTAPNASEPPTLRVIHPQRRKIVRVVGQPSFVQSYERTSIYPKLTAYIEKWNVDIGDRVQKGDVLADLFVPELREDWQTKKAMVEYDAERVRLAQKDVEVAAARVKAARARLDEARAIYAKYQAEVDRWEVQVKRIAREVERNVIAPQILLESQNELKADAAARDAADATIAKAAAELQAEEATLARAKVNVAVARADLAVAESDAKRLEALVGYLKLFAPYDGIIVARNANTWDFVLPKTGDPTADPRAPHLSPGNQAAPIYVVERTDIVRIYVDIPERDADFVHIGAEARVKLWAFRDAWIPATVTRLSWALNAKSRTMRAEIDLPNSDSRMLPGMYAYGKVIVERPDVQVLPKSAITYSGGKSFIRRYDHGYARRTEIQTGIEEAEWVEVTNRHVKSESTEGEANWTPIGGSDQVLVGPKLPILTEGERVKVDNAMTATGDEFDPKNHEATNAG
jgi:multidrug efflux pump subunit AcrA (membrane-fusion protein)